MDLLKLSDEKDNQTLSIQKAQEQVFNASTPRELTESVIVLTQAKKLLDGAKKALKEAEAPYKNLIKELEAPISQLEDAVKDKFLETYKSETVLYTKVDESTGEVITKAKEKDNKGEKMFIYTPEKTTIEVDMSQISQETHPHLFKQVWVLDNDKVQADILNLPKKEVKTPAKVGIQFKAVEEIIKNQLEAEAQNALNEQLMCDQMGQVDMEQDAMIRADQGECDYGGEF